MNSNLQDLVIKIEQLEKSLLKLQSYSMPSGVVLAFAMDKIPNDWLFCDGREVPRKKFPDLFQAIGTTYGAGDGYRTFNIPDIQGFFIRGLDETEQIDPERILGDKQGDALQGHRHNDLGHTHEGKTNTSGKHDHKIKEKQFHFRNWGGDELYAYCYNGSGKDDAGVHYAGEHSHNLKIKQSRAAITDPVTGKFGNVRVDIETRPKNISLKYCIKI